MLLSKNNILKLSVIFKSLLEERMSPETSFIIASNFVELNSVTEKIRKSYNQVEGYGEFVKERDDILMDLGTGVGNDGRITIAGDKAAYLKNKLNELSEKHSKTLSSHDEYEKEFNKMLSKEIEIDVQKINKKELPEKIEPSKLVELIRSGLLE